MSTPIDTFNMKILNAGDKLDNAGMDALVGTDNVQHKTKYLQTLTKNLDNNFTGFFVVVTAADELIAWTYFFIDSHFGFHGLLSGIMEKLYKIFPVKFNTAFISSPIAEYNMIHIKDEYKDRESFIVDKMMDEVLKFLKTERVKLVVVKDHINKYASDYFQKKFIHMHFMPGTYLDFESVHSCGHYCNEICNHGCNCFDDYVMSLKKKWRANIRNKINRRKEDLTVEVVDASNLSVEECVRCHELYFHLREKQRLKHECLTSDYFCECGKDFGDSCKMIIARADNKIIGFAQLLENGNDVINVRMGMDYKYNKEYNLYYHLLYENIVYCIRRKKKRLYTSQTAYRPKLEVGAKILPLHTYIYFTNPLFQKFFGRLIAKNCQCYSELIATDNPSEVLSKYKLSPY